MLKQPRPTLHKTTRPEITSRFGEAKLVLDETTKAISPFGGLASFISFLGSIALTPPPAASAPTERSTSTLPFTFENQHNQHNQPNDPAHCPYRGRF